MTPRAYRQVVKLARRREGHHFTGAQRPVEDAEGVEVEVGGLVGAQPAPVDVEFGEVAVELVGVQVRVGDGLGERQLAVDPQVHRRGIGGHGEVVPGVGKCGAGGVVCLINSRSQTRYTLGQPVKRHPPANARYRNPLTR